MFEPVRGGTRGGQAEFKWSDVSADKDREHYLGHSVNAPTGRWQKNKDVHWYNRENDNGEEAKAAEIKRIKQLEADALAVALGFEPAPKDQELSVPAVQEDNSAEVLERAKEKEEKRRRKAERRGEKAARKQAKLERKAREREDPDTYRRRTQDRSRSRSPRRHRSSRSPHGRPGRDYSRKSLSPEPRSSHLSERRMGHDYDAEERERQRERDRRRWDMNSRRELPSHRR
ncbi:hypothetical protein D9756_003229 [Leucocoprinus leucothites]|uniref:Multiple myeloma tumor-associated protein 2-like N-terminal domain-containing protein n=1 Tax=Leucocoprinus leucothites TaxID=201217 RepID=A0A8H5LJS8_9AGAR|nr:hypothetical protein D9756_003229 [Leucoagaricus leucothites]